MLTKSGYFVLIGANVMNSFQVDLNTNVKICFFRRCTDTDTFLGFRDKKFCSLAHVLEDSLED